MKAKLKYLALACVGAILVLGAVAPRTPLLRAFLQSNLDGNGFAITNAKMELLSITNANNLTNWALLSTNYVPLEAGHSTNADNANFATNAPTGYGVADTNWVLTQISQLGSYCYFLGATNSTGFTVSGEGANRTNVWNGSLTPFTTAATQTVSGLVLNAYIRHIVSTNTLNALESGPVVVSSYPFRTGGGGTVAGHWEIYFLDTVSNIAYEIGSSASQVVSATSPTRQEHSVSITSSYAFTNATVMVFAYKLDQIGTGGPTLSFAYGGIYDAHATFIRPLSSATINASQITGAPLNIGGTATAWKFTGTNFNHSGTTVASLPTPAANEFPIFYATDAITSSGVGGYVRWNGTAWKTWENVTATANLTNYAVNVRAENVILKTPTTFSISGDDGISVTTSLLPRASGTTGTGASVGVSTANAFGVHMNFATGTDTNGHARAYSILVRQPTDADIYACAASFYVSSLCSGTETYWLTYGADSSATATYPTTGAFFVYDAFTNKVTGVSAGAAGNWICAVANSSSYTYVDSGLPATTSTSVLNRLMIIGTTNSVLFYTNGVLSQTITTGLPSAALFLGKVNFTKSAGTTSRSTVEFSPWVFHRHNSRTY